MSKLRELNTANLRRNENIGNFSNVLNSHEKSLLLSCVNAIVNKYNELVKEPAKYRQVLSNNNKEASHLFIPNNFLLVVYTYVCIYVYTDSCYTYFNPFLTTTRRH
jgi:hypothetical protein